MSTKEKTGKGLEGWVAIFAGGRQIDSKGRGHDGDSIIDKAIETFNPDFYEPPAVVGHPKENAPAYAWVSGLKKETTDLKGIGKVPVLFAKFKDVVKEFNEAVKEGLYKKRSASFYANGRLRHVGFLGAAAPAVKGLPNIAFSEGEEVCFEFADPTDYRVVALGRIMQRLRDFIIEKYDTETADRVISSWQIEDLLQEPQSQGQPGFCAQTKEDSMSTFTEEQVSEKLKQQKSEFEAKLSEAKKEGRQEVAAEFAEKEKKRLDAARHQEIADFCERLSLGDKPKIIPAWKKMGIVEFMQNLDAEGPFEFSEGKKSTSLDWFKKFLQELPKVVEFKEIAGDGDIPGKEEKREHLISEFMEKNQGVSFREAALTVSKKYPDLFHEEEK